MVNYEAYIANCSKDIVQLELGRFEAK